MSTFFRLAMLTLLVATMCPRSQALEVGPKPPSYLDEKFRADWHMKPLAKVLDELGGWIEKPVTRSPAIVQLEDRTVALVDEHKVPLRDTLEALERTQHLHITVETLRLRVETTEDYRDRSRRLVDLNLRDYGAFFTHRDFPAKLLGFTTGMNDGGLSMFSDGSRAKPATDQVLERVARSTQHLGMELRGNGNVFISATPEEEAEVRKTLDEMYRATIRRTDWRVTFGTVPAAGATSGGTMTRAEAAALIAQLKDARSLTLTSLNGQRVNGATRHDRSYLSDVDIVSGHLDPNVQVLSLGQSAELRGLTGLRCDWVGFHLAWTDPLPDGTPSEIRATGGTRSSSDTTVTLNKDDNGPVTATVAPALPPQSGETVTVVQPAVWTWQPQGECYLPKGTAMVFVAEHPAGRAVIVLEETSP